MKGNPEVMRRQRRKSLVAVGLNVPVALIHFLTGPAYSGPYPAFVNGYLLDILVPFAFYFLLCPSDLVFPFLRPWWVKALPIFAAGCTVEISQFYGLPIFGQTYDPLDFIMYGLGVMFAALLDTSLFPRLFDFWTPPVEERR